MYPGADQDQQKYLDGLEKLAGAGDVLLVDSFLMTGEATRTAYFLDLNAWVNQHTVL